MMPLRLQLVVPCYNEAHRLKPAAFVAFLASTSDTGLLFVDDGSTDATGPILADLVTGGGGRIFVLTFPRNMGKAHAVRSGVLAAMQTGAAFVGYWDADLSTPLAAVPEFLAILESNPGVDVVIGSRVKLLGRRIDRNPVRHYCGRIFATAASLVLRLGIYDTQCGAKIFRTCEPVRQAFTDPFRSRWIVDVEILARYVAAAGGSSAESRICELPLRAWTEVPGSKLGARQVIRAAWDLAVIAWESRRRTRRRAGAG